VFSQSDQKRGSFTVWGAAPSSNLPDGPFWVVTQLIVDPKLDLFFSSCKLLPGFARRYPSLLSSGTSTAPTSPKCVSLLRAKYWWYKRPPVRCLQHVLSPWPTATAASQGGCDGNNLHKTQSPTWAPQRLNNLSRPTNQMSKKKSTLSFCAGRRPEAPLASIVFMKAHSTCGDCSFLAAGVRRSWNIRGFRCICSHRAGKGGAR